MTTTKDLALAAAALGLAGTLAACGASQTTGTDAEAEAAPSSASGAGTTDEAATTEATTDEAAESGTYADGTYTATGGYVSPGGAQEVTVSLTLAGDVVTAVEVTPGASDPQSEQYQEKFASGIADVVVGVALDDLEVDKVAGSSLTSGGFNEAVEAIRAEAAA